MRRTPADDVLNAPADGARRAPATDLVNPHF
ncbi:hypothetical protein HNR72_000347 [Streptomyces collinus]|uniref:Uncharacterized protein n=1 Tax=Streptomyces collinus TaxID=42684 RepID=A0AA89TE53_STRCU|nr:hypothetical protein [Streptomyces collinus]